MTHDGGAVTVLVVDDDPFVRDMIASILQDGGYAVLAAGNGAAAAALFGATSGIGLIVSDMNMPEMDGLGLTRAIRGAGADVPIIILTGNNEVTTAIQALKSGADDLWESSMVLFLPGSSLALYTDGLNEVRNREGAEFGEAALESLLCGNWPPNVVIESSLLALYSEEFGMDILNIAEKDFQMVDASLARLLPLTFCLKHKVLPVFRIIDEDLRERTLAVTTPFAEDVIAEVARLTACRVTPVLATSAALAGGIAKLY